jgi:hypothetical protein
LRGCIGFQLPFLENDVFAMLVRHRARCRIRWAGANVNAAPQGHGASRGVGRPIERRRFTPARAVATIRLGR